ncbi:MAG: class I SAM-dependent methyltransferase [Planctomycetes bacterium]|nr:class I SAM-dependent methyltransferase [Planctomycetota bacterium]
MQPTHSTIDVAAEADAFDRRIRERVAAGFVPDLRRAVRCEHFYKSFWRDPQFIDLYLGRHVVAFLELIADHAGPSVRILDVGCGAGYVSLELARAGHHVHAIDVSSACIEIARETLATNPWPDGFGSLEYDECAFEDVDGQYDVVLFSGCLHHLPDVEAALERVAHHLRHGGHLLCGEPRHERWRVDDAAQVALIRALLSITGHWYEGAEHTEGLDDEEALRRYIDEIHEEFVHERDPHEAGQSPHDNVSTGSEILAAARRRFQQVELRPTPSFIYRLLGGLRGDSEVVARLADFIAAYDRLGVSAGFLQPNGFIFMGRRD